jgi:NAD(P)-dependent dehydrogenase (short-subunit alcohol dehydrogenase family)
MGDVASFADRAGGKFVFGRVAVDILANNAGVTILKSPQIIPKRNGTT